MRSTQTPRPDADADDLGNVLHVARADRGTKLIFLAGSVLAFAAVAIVWGDFSDRFGSPTGWLLTLWYNPRVAAPGAIVIVAALFRALVLSVVSLLRSRPRGSLPRWNPRYPRAAATMGRRQRSLSCSAADEIRGHYRTATRKPSIARGLNGRRVDLPHRFEEMSSLIRSVRDRVEPILLERARRTLEGEGSLLFGPLVTVTPEGLLIGRKQTLLPLANLKRCSVKDCQFLVFDTADKLVFAHPMELIPNVDLIGRLVDGLRT